MKKKICVGLLACLLLTACSAAPSSSEDGKKATEISSEAGNLNTTAVELKSPTDPSLESEEGDYLYVKGTVQSTVEGVEETQNLFEMYIQVSKNEPIFNSEFMETGNEEAAKNMATALGKHVGDSFSFSIEGGDGRYTYEYKIIEIFKTNWIFTVAGSTNDTISQENDMVPYLNEWFEKANNYGFVLSTYSDVCDVNLEELFHGMLAGIHPEITDEDIANVTEMWGAYEDYELNKATTAELDAYLLQTTGHKLSEMSRYDEDMASKYCAKNDSYYSNVTDTNYTPVDCLTCFSIGKYKYALCGDLEGKGSILVLDSDNLVVANTMLR